MSEEIQGYDKIDSQENRLIHQKSPVSKKPYKLIDTYCKLLL